MTDANAEHYLAMAEWFRKNGFGPEWKGKDGSGCFIAASNAVTKVHGTEPYMEHLRKRVRSFADSDLRKDGWTTARAIAACEAAAKECP